MFAVAPGAGRQHARAWAGTLRARTPRRAGIFRRIPLGIWGSAAARCGSISRPAIAVVLLTNRTWPDRANQAIRQVRPAFHDAVREAFRLALPAASSHIGLNRTDSARIPIASCREFCSMIRGAVATSLLNRFASLCAPKRPAIDCRPGIPWRDKNFPLL